MNHNEQEIFKTLLKMKILHDQKKFVVARGMKTVELMNHTMKFDTIGDGIIKIDGFSTNDEYVNAELDWYYDGHNKATFISEFASMWSNIEDERGYVNSNYGSLIFSPQNCYQYDNVVSALIEDPQSRRAVMIYCPPHIHYTRGNDMICTMYVSYTIRDDKLHAFVSMRSNDLRFGVVGADLAWQIYVLRSLSKDLDVKVGNVHWHAVSLHLYERHFSIFNKMEGYS